MVCWKPRLLPALLQCPSSPEPVRELESPRGHWSQLPFTIPALILMSLSFSGAWGFFFNLTMYFKSISVGFIQHFCMSVGRKDDFMSPRCAVLPKVGSEISCPVSFSILFTFNIIR